MLLALGICALFLLGLHAATLLFLVYILRDFSYRLLDRSLHSRDHPSTDNGGWGSW